MSVPEVHPDNIDFNKHVLIDVRTPEEFIGELGHIKGARLISLGSELETYLEQEKNKEQEIVFVCRSGKRSAAATLMALEQGFKLSFNMIGGMILWNDLGLEVKKKN